MTATALTSLQIPPEFSRYESITDTHILNEWRTNTLRDLRDLAERARRTTFTLQEQADIIFASSAFDGNGSWITNASRETCQEILESFPHPETALLEKILKVNIKPLFQSNPHPSLNLVTGRKLSRPAGGPMASQDYYEGQSWKRFPGAANQVSWCVRHIESDSYEMLWPLIIPPIMTLLDDFEAMYKLRGVEIVLEMLERVPKEILKRTGVDGLLLSSLSTCLTHLQSPETPSLLRTTISTILSLILLTTAVGSADRFNQLCGLYDGIIGGVWLYGSEKLDAILATLDALPPVIRALRIGNARYLKALIPQLVHPLLPNEYNPSPVELQISSLCVLAVVIDECSACVHRWKIHILDGIARCWVASKDHGGSPELQTQLLEVCRILEKACPSVIQVEHKLFLAADPEMFGELFNRADA